MKKNLTRKKVIPQVRKRKAKEEILEQEPWETLNVSNSDETVVTSNRSEEDKMAKPYNLRSNQRPDYSHHFSFLYVQAELK